MRAPIPRAVLIVDDDPELLEVLGELLRRHGYATHPAQSGRAALALYPAVEPALIILDDGLDDMSGSELLRKLRHQNVGARRPALFLTGARANVECLPGDVVLDKPVDISRLLEVVLSLMPAA